MHTDESVNAYLIGELLGGGIFHYDPQDRHGPALAAETLPVVRLLGAKNFATLTEPQLRIVPVLTSAATVLLFGGAVELFGFIPCMVAALLFALAPLPVYYSRYFIHETLFVAATLGLILSGGHALQKKSFCSGALTGFCAALMLACKETAALHFFAIGLALACARLAAPHLKCPPPKNIFAAAAASVLAGTLLFTWFGQNWRVFDDLVQAIPNFAARAGGQGHEKPFWYYGGLLAGGRSGAVILLVAVLGFFRGLRTPSSAARIFIAIYALALFLVYSTISYKTPWIALNLWLPLALLAGVAVEWLWLISPQFFHRTAIMVLLTAIGILTWQDTRDRVFQWPADEKNPYAYAHTGEDLLRLPPRIDELARQNQLTSPRIAVVATDAWPLPW